MMADDGSRSGADVSRGSSDHIPVLLDEVIAVLAAAAGETIVDATFGAGGYTRAILEAADCTVIAFDRDPTAGPRAAALAEIYTGRLAFHASPFSAMAEVVDEPVDGIVMDIGVSSMQLDDPARGFSFQSDGPLDMRMWAAGEQVTDEGPSAADIVNTMGESQLADLIYHLGDERRSRAIARAIVKAREQAPLQRTRELAELVRRVYGKPPRDGHHPATRTFQALRIAVNDELGELFRGLAAAEKILKPGGRLVVVTFHSLEDRIVKKFFSERSRRSANASRHAPENRQVEAFGFRNVNHRPLGPSNQEIARNPRARSSKLRYGVRTDAKVEPLDPTRLGVPHLDLD